MKSPQTTGSRLAVSFFLLKGALQKLLQNDPLRMAGATAFFTTFALPFVLILLSQVLGLFLHQSVARKDLYQTLSNVLGAATVDQVIDILRAFRSLANTTLVTLLGVVFLLLVSTTLLMVIKGSINQIWRIRVKPGRSFLQTLGVRLRSLLIIIGTGLLFFLNILAEGLNVYIDSTITSVAPAYAYYIGGVFHAAFSVVFVTFWFTIIFRLLPDARVPWTVALGGAFVTSLLFNTGKYILRFLLVNSKLNTLYGASASLVLLLLFVFYSALILYYGVAFTKVLADHWQKPIRPLHYARQYKLSTVQDDA